MSEEPESATGTSAVAATSDSDSAAQPETAEVGAGAGVTIPHVQLQLPAPDDAARPSTAVSSILQRSAPATAATSMLTIVPVEDEKIEGREGTMTGVNEGEASASGNAQANDASESTAQPTPIPLASPQVILTFLLISGTRRGMSFDPTTTVGRVKELVWNAWPTGKNC